MEIKESAAPETERLPETPNQGLGGGGGGDMEIDEKIKKTLFQSAMQGNWEDVVSIYTKNRLVQAAKITRSEDTVLHVAVSDGKKDIVKQLVDAVDPDNAQSILEKENDKGNTPLHLAATLGMVEACAAMAKKCPSLVVKARNKQGETPLFLAAKYGKKSAFFALQAVIERNPEVSKPGDLSYCRRQDGNTILHVAINAEHFELAFEIIVLYERLVKYNNENGETALHCLANKPQVFKSGGRFGMLDTIIYSCTFVDPLVARYPEYKDKIIFEDLKAKVGSDKFPPNYKTCYDVFELLERFCNTLFSGCKHRSVTKCYIADEENAGMAGASQTEHAKQEIDDTSNQLHNGSSYQRRFPEIYETSFNLFKLVMKIFLVILGIGLWRTTEIRKNKTKNIYACHIMDALVTRSLNWEYDEDGKKPDQKSLIANDIGLPSTTPSIDDQDIDKSNGREQEPISKEPPGASTNLAPKNGATDSLKKMIENFSSVIDQHVDQKYIVILETDKSTAPKEPDGVTPILVAAKRGVTEMVEKILDNFPVAVQDMDSNDKNIVLLAVEHRQPNIYQLMLKRNIMRESVFGRVDKLGNSALHLAATLGQNRPWSISGAALQMQWEIKWYKFVLNSIDRELFPQHNKDGQTAREIFTEKHEQLVKDGGTWLNNTSQSCSVVAALIATVAFASATTVPGGVNQGGFPTLEGKPEFQIFAISALVALCFSVTSLIMFLSILTSRYQEWDFENDLPVKLILGLTSLFMSIAAMLVSFCAGHFFVVEKKLKYVTYPIYAVMALPVTFFAVAQFPLYVDLLKSTFAHVPQRTEKIISSF